MREEPKAPLQIERAIGERIIFTAGEVHQLEKAQKKPNKCKEKPSVHKSDNRLFLAVLKGGGFDRGNRKVPPIIERVVRRADKSLPEAGCTN